VLDTITVERRGVPAAMLGAEKLVLSTGRGMARLQGAPDLPMAMIRGAGQLDGTDLDRQRIVAYGAELAPQVEDILLRGAIRAGGSPS
jgi:hypothetical protein